MTEQPDGDNGQQQEERSTTFVVPDSRQATDDLSEEERASELQQVRDLGSASRSCVAIIAVLLIVALLICIFLVWATFMQ